MPTQEQPTFLETISQELLAKYRKLDSVITHSPSKGSYHEKILREVIKGYLPSSFSTGEGFLINQDADTSSQIDILIVDNLDPRSYGYKEGDFFIASDMAVASIGEVKTYATKNDFISSFHKLVNAKMLIKETPAKTTCFMFCYDARATESTLSSWVDEAIGTYPSLNDSKPWHFPDYVFCLKKDVFLERKQSDNSPYRMQYFTAMNSENTPKNLIKQLIVQNLFQCVTNGCGRLRELQGIRMLRE